jgi:hypothetical protein
VAIIMGIPTIAISGTVKYPTRSPVNDKEEVA